MTDFKYKNYFITYNFYNGGEFSVHFCGDDLLFQTLEDAKKFIDEIGEN